MLDTSVVEAQQAVDIVVKEYRLGTTDFNRVALIEQTLVQQQDLQAQAHGDISSGLIQVYRALGGGWEIPPTGNETLAAAATVQRTDAGAAHAHGADADGAAAK